MVAWHDRHSVRMPGREQRRSLLLFPTRQSGSDGCASAFSKRSRAARLGGVSWLGCVGSVLCRGWAGAQQVRVGAVLGSARLNTFRSVPRGGSRPTLGSARRAQRLRFAPPVKRSHRRCLFAAGQRPPRRSSARSRRAPRPRVARAFLAPAVAPADRRAVRPLLALRALRRGRDLRLRARPAARRALPAELQTTAPSTPSSSHATTTTASSSRRCSPSAPSSRCRSSCSSSAASGSCTPPRCAPGAATRSSPSPPSPPPSPAPTPSPTPSPRCSR